MLKIVRTQRVCLLSSLIIIGLVSTGALNAKEEDKKDQKPFLNKPVSPKQSIRFYKANKQLQADKIALTGGDTQTEGCQNMLKKTRVFKALQIGFGFCALYEEKDCAIDSLVPVQSEKQKHSTNLLTEGVGWFTQGEDDRGVKVASWNCGSILPSGEMRAEHQLARQEVKRLRDEKASAKRELEQAQAAFAEAEKRVGKAKQYAKRTRQEAIATGVIEPPKDDTEQAGEESQSDSD